MEQQSNDKRQFFRIKSAVPLCGSMKLCFINGKPIKTSPSSVCIENMGPGGLCVYTNLDLPIGESIILKFEVKLLEEDVIFYGSIVRKKILRGKIKEYGIKFNEKNTNITKTLQIMNKWSIALKKSSPAILKRTCSLCTRNIDECFS